MAIAIALGTHQVQAQTQVQAQAITEHSHNISPGPFSPFLSQATDSNGAVVDYLASNGFVGDLVAGEGNITTVSGTITVVGNSSAVTSYSDGNRLPTGVTLSYDLAFRISTADGLLVTAGGNTGNGLAPGDMPFGAFDPGESIEFTAAQISNVAFTGTPTAPDVTFTPGTVSDVGLSQFRSANFVEATNGAVLDNGTDSVGFGISTGSLASGVAMNNGFFNGTRFPALSMASPITLTMDAASAGTFNLKGIEFTTSFDYEVVTPFDGLSAAFTNYSHNTGGLVSPFFTQATDQSNGTIYEFAADFGLAGSIVAGAADRTTVSGTVEIVGNATAANDFANGNQLPEGMTLTYDLSFTISSQDGLLTTAGGNTGNGIGIGPDQYEAINDGEQLVFSPGSIANVTFTGTPVDNVSFTAGDLVDVALSQFRSNNFPEATAGAVLSNGTDTVGFGLASGSLASNVSIANSFPAADRFPPISMRFPLTLTADAGVSSFNLKGFELATIFTYETSDGFLLGDVNQDGQVDFLDIAPFITLLTNGGFLNEGDINQDGTVDFLDIAPFIALLTS